VREERPRVGEGMCEEGGNLAKVVFLLFLPIICSL